MREERLRQEVVALIGEEMFAALLRHIDSVPDQSAFFTNFLNVAERVERADLEKVLGNARTLRVLVPIFACSSYLSGLMMKDPGIFREIFVEEGYRVPVDPDVLMEEILDRMALVEDEESAKRLLRKIRNREIVRIGARDLSGMAEVEETTAALSDLADACLEGAVNFSLRAMKKRFGSPTVKGDCGASGECGFCVIGMGKLGGRELNFSSDIDIMYIYESDRGETTGVETGSGEIEGRVTNHQFFVKVAEMVTRLIGEATDDGIVFRVDLRLRPDGTKGPLANSLRSLEIYYESWGQTWERAALIKARPVAGDRKVGETFIRMMTPFVFRKYLDFIAIEEIKELKDRIDLVQRVRMGKLWDVKLGEGGIREIEFFIQVHQLIFGGKNPKLRVQGTLQALAILRAERFISPAEEEGLREAYRFFRNLEHRLQILSGKQTQELPSGTDLEKIAYLMGFEGGEKLVDEVEKRKRFVAEIFGRLFAKEKEKEEVDVPPEVIGLLYGEMSEAEEREILERFGFGDVDGAREHLEILRNGPPFARLSDRARKYLRKVAPIILWEAIKSPNPDRAVDNVEEFIQAIGARTTFYALLYENPMVIPPLLHLFGSSQFLSGFLISHPELVDMLLRKGQSEVIKSRGDMRRELGERLVLADDFEEELAILRNYRNEEFLRIGIHKLAGNLSLEEFSHQLSSLAEVLMGYAMFFARREVERKYGKPGRIVENGVEREVGFCILGLGKLGGEELNFHSDLDILFVYSHMGQGEKLTNNEFFAKVAQRFISILTTVTREGYVYKVDMRLRPSGSAGPLVVSREAFENYYLKSAWLFERQALIKARFVAGDRVLGKDLERWISWYVYERPLPENLKQEINRLRERMEHELARESRDIHNIKYGRGGIVDVEFLVQFLQLLHGREHISIRSQNTLKALYELRRAGIIGEDDFEVLDEGYRFLRNLEISMRLVHDTSVERLMPDDRSIRLLNVSSVREFEERYEVVTAGIRKVYRKFFD